MTIDRMPESAPVHSEEEWNPREKQALSELAVTGFSTGVRTALIISFLAILVTIPIFEGVSDFRNKTRVRSEMLAAGADPSTIPRRRPRALQVFELLPSLHDIGRARTFHDVFALLPTSSEIRNYENDLLINSPAAKVVRPWYQYGLSRVLGVGSQNVIIGWDRWLYYRDGYTYAAGPPFLDANRLAVRSYGGNQPDPRPAIIQFNEELKRAGVTLIVVPIPDKAVIRPGSLARNLNVVAPLQNASWNSFNADLKQHGVLLLDLTQEMFDAERSGHPQFMPGDSHWSPLGVDVAAHALVRFLEANTDVRVGSTKLYHAEARVTNHEQDLVGLLDVPASHAQEFGRIEQIHFNQILDASGDAWRPDTSADVLFMGDSFLEYLAVPENGAIMAGGLVQQVSYLLQRPVAREASPRYGEFDTRTPLGVTLAEVRANAPRRKVVIWEFAMRKLQLGSWSLLK